MKILYAIQGTGNGHLSRAREFIPALAARTSMDVLISGTNADVKLNHPVRYRFNGLSYSFGKNGGIDYLSSWKNLLFRQFARDVTALPVHNYDLVISDYEPVSAWASKRSGIPCVGLSHQSAFLSSKTPRAAGGSRFTELLFKYYAPCSIPVGFHYKNYDSFIHTPVIRTEVRQLKPSIGKHITVYLPAWSEEKLIPVFQRFPSFQWHIFSKHTTTNRAFQNVVVRPVSNESYLSSLETAWGVITGGGFEAPAEALYLGKKLMVVPMHDQYEQQCNAEALKSFDIHVVPRIGNGFYHDIQQFLDTNNRLEIRFPHHTESVIEQVLASGDVKATTPENKHIEPIRLAI